MHGFLGLVQYRPKVHRLSVGSQRHREKSSKSSLKGSEPILYVNFPVKRIKHLSSYLLRNAMRLSD